MRSRTRTALFVGALGLCALLAACGPAPANAPNLPVQNLSGDKGDGGFGWGPGVGLLVAFTIAVIVFHRREKNEPEP